jgi:hypothetical protein
MRKRILPYKTKADQEREKWMTLPEAVAHICSALGCDERGGRRQLIAALSDGARYLQHLKWEREQNDRLTPIGYSPGIIPMDTPPLGRTWLEAKIRWKTGRVRDDWGGYNPGKWRVLLISRYGVARLWPLPASFDAVELGAPELREPEVGAPEVRESEVKVHEVDAPEAPVVEAPRPTLKDDTEAEYQARLAGFQQEKNHYPSRVEDEKWGKQRGIRRERVRELRQNFLPVEVHKGGRRRGAKFKTGRKNNLAAKLPS